jgi:hypothetical protein
MRRIALRRIAVVACVLAAGIYLPLRSAAMAPAATCSPALQAASLSPASVPGGASATFTATLNCAAPKALTMSVKGFTGVKVPATLTVAAGKSTGSVTVTTATTKTARKGWIVATLGKVSHEKQLTVTVTPKTCSSPALSSASLPSLAYVGDHPVLALKLSCVAGAAVHLSVTSSNASLPVPATVTIGKYYSAASVPLTPKAYEPGQYQSTVSVHFGTKTLTRAITVNPGLLLFELTPTSAGPNNVSPNILFTGGLPAGGAVVSLSSDNAAITVPATVAFTQPGSLGGGFLGMSIHNVTKSTKVTLSATLGSVTRTASVTLIPPWPVGHTITLSTDWGSGPLYGPTLGHSIDIILSNPADPQGNGLGGTVTTDHPGDVQLDESTVNVIPGWNNTSVSFSVPYETAAVHATITVTIDGVTASIPVTIEPSLSTVTAPATIVGGQAATGTVTLAGAPDVPDTVDLQSSWGILTVPSTVTIPAGQTSATFPITTVPVDSDSQVSISASHTIGGFLGADSVGSDSIDVTPPAS